ncbi:MAG TPA: hypothetical protein VGM50_10100 [Gemmatimonadaceae bacterium]
MAFVATVGVVAAAACSSDSTGVAGNTQAQLAFMASGSANGDLASAAIVPITNGAHTLNFTAISLTINRAELKRATTDSCANDNDNDDEDDDRGDDHGNHNGNDDGNRGNCSELKVGPAVVDIPLTGNVVTVPADVIPAGTFRELELRVSQVELKGTFDSTAFDVKIPVNARAEIEFDTPLVVTAGTPTSITVNVPVGNILVNADGSLIDPSKILSTPSLLATVKTRILASFHAFEDRDHDGRDDHRGPGNGNGKGGGPGPG